MTEITKTTPLRLEDAVRLAFPAGGMTVSGLRTERRKGNLAVMMLAGKEFTTLAAIEDMLAKCIVKAEPARVPFSASRSGVGSDVDARRAVAMEAARATGLRILDELREKSWKDDEAKAIAEGRKSRRRRPAGDKA